MRSWVSSSSSSNASSVHPSTTSSPASPTSRDTTTGCPTKGSIRRLTEQTSPGEPGLGTTFVDTTSFGLTPGEIAEFEPPHTLVYHWWDRSRSGRLHLEGWPAYSLEVSGDGTTLVRHHARVVTHGIYRPATPVLRRIAVRERTATMEALKASFEPGDR